MNLLTFLELYRLESLKMCECWRRVLVAMDASVSSSAVWLLQVRTSDNVKLKLEGTVFWQAICTTTFFSPALVCGR